MLGALGLPRRVEMAILLFTGAMASYLLRVNVSVSASQIKDDLGWTEAQKGLLLSSFYWGYTLGQVPAAQLVQYFGAKWIFGLSVLLPSIITLFSPVATRSSFGLALFMRVLVGIFESTAFPAIFQFIPIWIPLEEKTLMVPFIYSGVYIGNIVGFSVSGSLLGTDIMINGASYGGWDATFYVFGLFGIAWFPIWMWLAYESPDEHPGITKEELRYIHDGKHYHTEDTPLIENPTADNGTKVFTSVDSATQDEEQQLQPQQSTKEENSEKDQDQDDDDEYHPLSDPIPIEHVAMNMIASSSSKRARIDGQTTSLKGRPRRISIVKDNRLRRDYAMHTPWKAFLTHPVAWALYLNSWTLGWIGLMLLSYMPSFLVEVLGFDLENASILCVFPYVALFIFSNFFGYAFEHLQINHGWSTNAVRIWSEDIGLIGSVVGLIICGFMNDKYVAYAFMIVTQCLIGATDSGISCAYSDIAPNYSSSFNTIGNIISSAAGIVGPLVISALLSEESGVWGWRIAFFIAAAQVVISVIIWHLYQTSNPIDELNNPTNKK